MKQSKVKSAVKTPQAPSIDNMNKCQYCSKRGATKKCGACKKVFYCNKKCQTTDWKKHAIICKLDGLIGILRYYKIYNNEENNNDKILEYFNTNKHFIINNYHYMLTKSKHDTTFKLIYDKIMDKNNNLFCDVSKCVIYKRNNREREKDKNENNLSVGMDILDCIHCYFLHSVDVGYRIFDQLKDDVFDNDDNDNYNNRFLDKQLFSLKSYLKSKAQNLQQIRGINRIKNNKFVTNFGGNNDDGNDGNDEKKENKSQQDNVDNEIEEKESDYSFGLRFDCWNKGKCYDYKIRGKYKSLKEELISNTVYPLEANVFDSAYNKAQCLMNISNAIKKIKSKNNGYGIKNGLSLNIDNILSIVLYTDYDTLSYNFSSIFRKTKGNESDKYLRKRGREYYHWIKILTETVNCYGTTMEESKIKILYHGVSFLYFNKFIATFNSPTSTTTKPQIATIFAKNDGIILELTKCYDEGISTPYFNCSFMSYFGNEDERLFIQPRDSSYYLQFVAIRNMKTDENYAHFINALTKFQKAIHFDDHGVFERKVSSECIDTINDLMDSSKNKQYPKYIIKSFKKWSDKIRNIDINRGLLNKYCHGFAIWNKNNDNLIQFDKLSNVFRNVTKIKCYNIDHDGINISYLSSLLAIIKLLNGNHSKLKEISLWCTGSQYMCSSAQFAKYQSLFAKNGWTIYRGGCGDVLNLNKN